MSRQTILNILLAFLFVIEIGGLFSIKTEGRRDYFVDANKELEQEYIKEIKAVLCEYRMGNAGITLTKVSEDGTYTEYTVKIHTGRENPKEMLERIEDLSPKISDCSVSVVFDQEDQ